MSFIIRTSGTVTRFRRTGDDVRVIFATYDLPRSLCNVAVAFNIIFEQKATIITSICRGLKNQLLRNVCEIGYQSAIFGSITDSVFRNASNVLLRRSPKSGRSNGVFWFAKAFSSAT